MPTITPEALAAALAAREGNVRLAAADLGVTRAWIYKAPELKAVLEAHREAAGPRAAPGRPTTGRDTSRSGQHDIALSPAALAQLDARAAARASVVGPKAASRSSAARELVEAALRGPLPPPEPAGRWRKVKLDLGPAWDALAAHLETNDPQEVAGVVRAILTLAK